MNQKKLHELGEINWCINSSTLNMVCSKIHFIYQSEVALPVGS